MSAAPPAAALRWPSALAGSVGRHLLGLGPIARDMTGVIGQVTRLGAQACYMGFWLGVRGKIKIKKQLLPLLTNVGVRSAPIVCLVSVLIGAILVLQTGETIDRFGQIGEAPGLVALSMTRALGPLMTAIVLIARVGASYTAVLGSMNINDEVVALRVMSINPVGYLVAPRLIAMVVMTPCLVSFSYLLGMVGGAVVAWPVYDITLQRYWAKSIEYLTLADVYSGLMKSMVFAVLISLISCHHGLAARGGPTGLGRNIMVSVVTCLVIVVLADAGMTAFINQYLLGAS
ncbi:MAG: ABC transporter permease [Planctomycetota bacterium]